MKRILLALMLLAGNLAGLTSEEKINFAVRRSCQTLPYYSEDKVNRMLELETGRKLGVLYFNIPGLHIKRTGQIIKRFGVDHGIAQINEINIEWTYELSRVLKEDISLARNKKLVLVGRKYGIHKNLISSLLDKQIPPIVLKRIQPINDKAYKDYIRIKGKSWKIVLKELNSRYKEQEITINDIESNILYRILIERDRHHRGWNTYL